MTHICCRLATKGVILNINLHNVKYSIYPTEVAWHVLVWGSFVHTPLHFFNLDVSPRINRVCLCKIIKVSDLQAHVRLAN